MIAIPETISLAEKLSDSKLEEENYSPKMRALMAFILGTESETKQIIEMSITCDNFVFVTTIEDGSFLLSSEGDLINNINKMCNHMNLTKEEASHLARIYKRRIIHF